MHFIIINFHRVYKHKLPKKIISISNFSYVLQAIKSQASTEGLMLMCFYGLTKIKRRENGIFECRPYESPLLSKHYLSLSLVKKSIILYS